MSIKSLCRQLLYFNLAALILLTPIYRFAYASGIDPNSSEGVNACQESPRVTEQPPHTQSLEETHIPLIRAVSYVDLLRKIKKGSKGSYIGGPYRTRKLPDAVFFDSD